jgi:cell division septum initiation protein DivIVA
MRLQAQARENSQLRAELERIEPELEELRKVESLLRGALVSAERTTAKLKDDARSEAETIVERARKHADELNTRAENDRHRLEQELDELEEKTRQVKERCREFLTQALEAIERSDSLTALDSEQQELPTPLGHLNDA